MRIRIRIQLLFKALAPLKDVQVTKEAFSSQKRISSTSKHEISFYFFLIWWGIFALLDPDPDSENGSGSTDLIESGSNPDPKPCFKVMEAGGGI
jgi:hypothetical protein